MFQRVFSCSMLFLILTACAAPAPTAIPANTAVPMNTVTPSPQPTQTQSPKQGGRTLDQKMYELQLHRQFLAQVINEKYRLLDCIYTQIIPIDP